MTTIRCANETCTMSSSTESNLPPSYALADHLQALRNQGWAVLDPETAYCPRCRKDFAP